MSIRLPLPFRLLLTATLLPALASTAEAPLSLTGSMQIWNPHGPWTVTGGVLSSSGGGSRNVLTAVPFSDVQLQFDYSETGPVGAKLRLWASKENSGGLTVDLDGSSSAHVGGIESLSTSSLPSLSLGWHHVQVQASKGQVKVIVDNLPMGSATGLGDRAGFIGFEAEGDGTLAVKDMKLAPLNLTPIYNGSDLGGWKGVARPPESKGGVGHDVTKTFTFGMAGGSAKPHDAKWSVAGGAIRGEDGPGGLENSNQFEDGIFQVSAGMKGGTKPENMVALTVRSSAGQLGSGYSIGIGPYAGAIDHVVNHPAQRTNGLVDETVVVAGRTFAVWVNGNLVTLHTDTRAENPDTAKGAKTAGGTLALLLSNKDTELDVQRLTGVALPKAYGVAARAPAPPPPVVPTTPTVSTATTATTTSTQPSGNDAALKALQDQQKKDAEKQERVGTLMGQALSEPDPEKQKQLYQQVIQIDPSNAGAMQGFKDAQTKVQAAAAQQQQQQTAAVSQQQQAQTNEQLTNSSLASAQSAFVGGHIGQASAALATAERLSPNNPTVRFLRTRINSAQSLRTRIAFLCGGAGLLGLLGVIALWWNRRKQQQYPVLEVTRGMEQGRTYAIEKDLVRIGALAQDGAQKNDIVIQDVEHAVSRFHCELTRKNGQIYVTDLKSANGTRLNGEPLQPGQPTLLRKGSTVTLANVIDLHFGYDRRAKTS